MDKRWNEKLNDFGKALLRLNEAIDESKNNPINYMWYTTWIIILKSENRIVVRDEQDGGKKRKLAKHDFLLKGYNHSASLDKVLKQPQPEIIVSFFQELIRRSALRIALAGRTDKQLRPIVDFLINNLRDPKFSRILVDVALILTEIYFNEVNRSTKTQEMFNRLNSVVKAETNAMNQILMITGQLNSILNYSSLNH